MTNQNIDINLIPGGVPPIVHASQFDSQTNAVTFTLYQGSNLFSLPSGAGVVVNGKKPDNTAFTYNAASASGNTVKINVTKQMCAVAGDVVCELRISTSNADVGTANFILRVEKSPLDDSVISETVLPLIEQAAEIASTISEYVESVAASAISASNAANTATSAAAVAATAASNVAVQYDALETVKTNANNAAAAANTAASTLNNLTATAVTLTAGSSATASYNSSTGVMTFGIPRGATGESGISSQTAGWFAMGVEVGGTYDGYLFAEYASGDLSADNFDYEEDGDLYFVTGE